MGIESDLDSALAKAVRAAGSQSAFARLIGRSQPWVHAALKTKRPLSAEHVLLVERETGISRHALRPDLYPREAVAAEPAQPPRDDRPERLEPVR